MSSETTWIYYYALYHFNFDFHVAYLSYPNRHSASQVIGEPDAQDKSTGFKAWSKQNNSSSEQFLQVKFKANLLYNSVSSRMMK